MWRKRIRANRIIHSRQHPQSVNNLMHHHRHQVDAVGRRQPIDPKVPRRQRRRIQDNGNVMRTKRTRTVRCTCQLCVQRPGNINIRHVFSVWMRTHDRRTALPEQVWRRRQIAPRHQDIHIIGHRKIGSQNKRSIFDRELHI